MQHYAKAVYQYVKASEEAVKGLEEIEKKSRPEGTEEGEDDDVRLLRLRTKKREIVIVPRECSLEACETPYSDKLSQIRNSSWWCFTIPRQHFEARSGAGRSLVVATMNRQ